MTTRATLEAGPAGAVTPLASPVAQGGLAVISTVTLPGTVFGYLAGFDADSLVTFSLAPGGEPEHGTVAFESNGYLYTPDPGYAGPDSFTYLVTDADGETATATIDITVAAETPLRSPARTAPTCWSAAPATTSSTVSGPRAFKATTSLTCSTAGTATTR